MECIELADGKYKRLPWPEYYLEKPKPTSNDPNNPSAGGTELVKEYPGASPSESVRDWGEVEFIEEMYKALSRFTTDIQLTLQGQEAASEAFIATPMLVKIDNKWLFSENNTPVDLFNYLMAKIMIMIYHNGLLFKQTDYQVRQNKDGIFDYFIANMITLLFPPDDPPINAYNTIGAINGLFDKLIDNNGAALKDYLTNNATEINSLILELFNKQDNIFVPEHRYFVATEKLPTETVKTKYLETNNTTGKATTYQMAPSGLPYHPKAIQVLNLFDFNAETMVNDINTKALIFTNTYATADGDLFITRK
jgi:hypothetical protein